MNDMQHEQLFTELTPAQAETTAGGRPIDDGGFGPGGSVNAFYGRAFATFKRTGQGSLTGSLFVKAIVRSELGGYDAVGTEVFIVGMGFNQSWV